MSDKRPWVTSMQNIWQLCLWSNMECWTARCTENIELWGCPNYDSKCSHAWSEKEYTLISKVRWLFFQRIYRQCRNTYILFVDTRILLKLEVFSHQKLEEIKSPMCVVSVTLTSCSVRGVKSLCILEYLTCEINFRRKGLIMQFTLQSGIGYSPKKGNHRCVP